MIRINNLFKKYGKLTALAGVSFDIKSGEFFALLGLNGAGKSTLINVLSTLIKKDSGTIQIDGNSLDGDKDKIKKLIALSPQETAIAGNLTVKENLYFIAELYDIKGYKEKTVEILKKFSLTEKENSRAKTLSGGQKRRLSVAAALISEPKILFLDEPTLGLDVKSRKILWDIIKELKGEITIILTTHYLEEAEALADRIGIISKGKMSAIGTVEEIIKFSDKKTFEDAFLSLAEEGEGV